MITPRSRAISLASNTGLRTRSLRISRAVGTCSSSTLTLKQMHSLAVKASMFPPMESTCRAISSAVRLLVPLKTMCSMKCEIPFHCASSSREPVCSHTPIEAERMCCICSVMMGSPLGSLGEAPYRANQILDAVYRQRVDSADKISTLPQQLRAKLVEARVVVGLPRIEQRFLSQDGSVRYLIGFPDGQSVETVWMPEGD